MIPTNCLPVVDEIRKCMTGFSPNRNERGYLFWMGIHAVKCSTKDLNIFSAWIQEEGTPRVLRLMFPVLCKSGSYVWREEDAEREGGIGVRWGQEREDGHRNPQISCHEDAPDFQP